MLREVQFSWMDVANLVWGHRGMDGRVGCYHGVEKTQEEIVQASIGESRSPSSQILLNRR
ncbi:MAG: hypothetical protein WAN35_06370 [Terracidiphilus sp.]